MKRFRLMRLLIYLATVLCLTAAPAQAATFLDLRTLGGDNSAATCINDHNQVVGSSETVDGFSQGFWWTYGSGMTTLGTLPGGSYSSAYSINNSNMIVGYSSTTVGADHACKWSNPDQDANGVMTDLNSDITDLGTLGGDNSYACGVNNLGQVVGYSQTAAGQFHAFLYIGGVMHDLGTLGGTGSYASGINNLGQVVGHAKTGAGKYHAFLYTGVPGAGGAMTDLGTLPGGQYSWARGINDRGQIVGYAHTASGQTHAFLYEGGVITDLGTLPGGTWSRAHSINNNGLIVGEATTAAGFRHAVLYNPSGGPSPALLLLLSEWLRPLTGWGNRPSVAGPPVAGPGGMGRGFNTELQSKSY